MFDFNLPILDRPILWYGFFFAFGFFIGYLFLTYLLRRYFLFFTRISKEEVASWPDLIKALKQAAHPIAEAINMKLSSPHKKWCQNWSIGDQIPLENKEAILSAMNSVIDDSEMTFKTALSPESKRLLFFAQNRSDSNSVSSVRKKLQLQQELFPSVVPLKQKTAKVAEQITFYVILGAIIGSRLGDVLFYQNWVDIARNPLSIIAVWEGGLASHGGAIGILLALGFFAKKRKIAFWTAVDFTVIPTAIAAVCIRIGNFFNQEILGIPTLLPWGITFLHPADGGPLVPRHPAQLYEAIAYLLTFVVLLFYWHRHRPFSIRGRLTGLFLVLVFSSRFLIEFIKVEQSFYLSSDSYLTMGQWLSLPFVGLGLWLLSRKKILSKID